VAGLIRGDQIADPVTLGTVNLTRLHSKGATAVTVTEWALDSDWGTSPTIDSVTGNDTIGTVRISSGSGSPAVNATATLTFKDGSYSTAPLAFVSAVNVTDNTSLAVTYTTTATTLVVNLEAAPVASKVHEIQYLVIGT
jgi:hypothetical protein